MAAFGAPTDPRRIKLQCCNPAIFLEQIFIPSDHPLHPDACDPTQHFLAIYRTNLCRCPRSQSQDPGHLPERNPRFVEAHSSSSIQVHSRWSRKRAKTYPLTFIAPESSWSRHTQYCIPCARCSALQTMELGSAACCTRNFGMHFREIVFSAGLRFKQEIGID